VDVTERKTTEHRLRTLTAELDHRVKNVLARVLALGQISQAGAGNDSPIAVLAGRIRSMAQTHALLSQTQWSGSRLDEIIALELEPYQASGNISISGPPVALNPEATQAMTMVLHELTTNAAKYGALSVSEGRVNVRFWTQSEPTPTLFIQWRESGGPKVVPPQQTGYGATVIRNSLAHEFDAKVDLSFKDSGVVCDISVSLDRVKAGAAPPPG
jgi:two-component sensor histidine kinase